LTRAIPSRSRERFPVGLRYWVPLLLLVVIAAAMSFVVRHEIYPAYSWNRDEPVYVWQTAALRDGKVLTSDAGSPEFFQPWLTGTRHHAFFSQYTPGWPAVLAASDLAFGTMGAALALGAALAVVGTYALARELLEDRRLALVAAAVMTGSPLLIVQSGLYLGYLFSLGIGLLFATLLLAGVRRRQAWRCAVAGLLLGVVFVTRPFDAVLWGAPFLAYLAVVHRREWRRVARAGAWLALGFAPLVVAGLLYNRHVTGTFTNFPITAADPLDKFGFGVRHIMPAWTPVDYTVWRAIRGSGRNLFFLPQFLVGSFLGLAVAGYGLWLRRRERATYALLALVASFPIGYFFFWGIYLTGSRVTLSGPLYYLPLYGALSILIAVAIMHTWRRRRAFGAALVAALVLVTIPVVVDKLDANRTISEKQAPWRASVEHISKPALVFVDRAGPYLLHLNPFSANTPDIDDGRIVYALDRGAENLDLIAAHPDRTPYMQLTDVVQGNGIAPSRVPKITLERAQIVRGDAIVLHLRVTNPTDSPVVVAYLRVGASTISRVLSTDAEKDATFETDWVVGGPGAAGDDIVRLTDPRGAFALGVGSAATADRALTARRVEERLSYRIVGSTVEVLTPGGGVAVTERGKTAHEREIDASTTIRLTAERR
jgi:4-amino-4-deoxy-L-arabinose transferase-like glycosyltransferase